MNADEMLRVQDAVFVLSSSIDDFCCELLALVFDRLAECVLNGRVVAVDKMAIDELYG
jgi:hypothetical protein